MGRPGRGIATGVAALAGALFTGHWIAGFLADRWWTAEVAPAAVALVTTERLIALGLEVGAIAFATAWFSTHFLLVARAIGSIQLPRRLGDLEIREAIPSSVVTSSAVVLALVLGVLLGGGAGRWAPAVSLAWHGVHIGLVDPILGHDAGLYVAQLPMWLGALGFLRALILAALAAVALLYLALGAVRVGREGIALSDHARIHLGILGAAVVALAAIATALTPLRAVGEMRGVDLPTPFQADIDGVVAVVLGSAALLLATWAIRGRGTLLIAGVIAAALALATILILPAVGVPGATSDAVQSFTAAAWGLGALDDRHPAESVAAPLLAPKHAAIWPIDVLVPAAQLNGQRVIAAGRTRFMVGDIPHPAWLLVRAAGDSAVVSAVADDQVNAAGGPLAFRLGDTLAYPGLAPFAFLRSTAVRPEAPAYEVDRAVGVPIAGALRRLALAWAVQAGRVLGAGDAERLAWRLDPAERVTALLPGVGWHTAGPVFLAAGPGWIVDGYVPLPAFPLSPRREWDGAMVNGVDPGLVAFVAADSGRVRVFLRPGAGPVAQAWAELSRGLIEPDSALPPAVRALLPYPADWLAIQGQVLMDGPFELPAQRAGVVPQVEIEWDSAARPVPHLAVTAPDLSERVVALISGEVRDGRLVPELLRLPPSMSLSGPRRLGRSWDRFASFGQLADSVVAAGGELVPGPIRYQMVGAHLVAAAAQFRRPPRGAATLAWVSVAVGDRVGAGRDLAGAWANLLGRSAPVIADPGSGDRLAQIRDWIARADSALHRGDLAAFGRAFDALKELAGTP